MNVEKRMIELLVAAGIVSQAKMDEARKLAESYDEDEQTITERRLTPRASDASDVRNPDSWKECPHCKLIHDPKVTKCWIVTGSSQPSERR